MATINPTTNVAFRGKNIPKYLNNTEKAAKDFVLRDLNGMVPPRKILSPMEALIERVNGYGYAQQRGHVQKFQELKEVMTREMMAGNFDFVAGIQDYLKTAASKNIYKK